MYADLFYLNFQNEEKVLGKRDKLLQGKVNTIDLN